jgi:hypothetical protein
LFWILALISLAWTGIVMVLKRADFMEICAELCRYILFTGFFFWLLQNGPAFAGDIINSLRQLGGKAAGGGQSIYPGDLITLGMQVVQNAMQHMNWLMPAVTGLPVLFGDRSGGLLPDCGQPDPADLRGVGRALRGPRLPGLRRLAPFSHWLQRLTFVLWCSWLLGNCNRSR